jgi:riboflavin biosynthesis pyrimidine reductase
MSGTEELAPLERLYEADSLPRTALPPELARLHGGELGFVEPCVYANFVATIDGVVAIPAMASSNDFIAADSNADRFLMGLLRAFADAILIGSGVLRASPRGTWLPEKIYPPAATAYADLRLELGAPPTPEIAVLTGSGSIDPGHPLLESGALVLTSEAGSERLAGRVPAASTVVALGSAKRIAPDLIVGALRGRGHQRILCEAGPHTFGSFLEAGVIDELFLTTSPLLVGDAGPGTRLALVEGTDLTPEGTRARLLSLRRHGSHVFHRYALDRTRVPGVSADG